MLPQFQTTDRSFSLMQNQWAKELNPIIALPFINQNTLKKVALVNGTTNINHLLGRNLQGWFIIRQRAAANIYDTQDTNLSPDLTLVLVSDAAVVVDLVVF